jgi:hypothetical protein
MAFHTITYFAIVSLMLARRGFSVGMAFVVSASVSQSGDNFLLEILFYDWRTKNRGRDQRPTLSGFSCTEYGFRYTVEHALTAKLSICGKSDRLWGCQEDRLPASPCG